MFFALGITNIYDFLKIKKLNTIIKLRVLVSYYYFIARPTHFSTLLVIQLANSVVFWLKILKKTCLCYRRMNASSVDKFTVILRF